MKDFKKYAEHISTKSITGLLKILNNAKYSSPVICTGKAIDDVLLFESGDFFTASEISNDTCKRVRKNLGEHVLLVRGLPGPEKEAHQVVLIPFPSMVKTLGLKKYMQFLKDWRGNSMVGSIEAIKYSVLL